MCENGIKWIYDAFDDCIVTTTDKISFSVGLFSVIVWLFSAFPEIYTIYKTKNVEGISPFLFSFLVCADTMSLIGNILNGGLVTQIITCILYVSCDATCLFMYLYYKCIKSKCSSPKTSSSIISKDDSIEIPLIQTTTVLTSALLGVAATAAVDYGLPYRGRGFWGQFFGWASACICISSRIPQVYLNFKRKFVSNLSPYYFLCTILGNVSYFLSLLIRNPSAQFMWKEAPWIVECLGPLTCDIITAFQFCIYGYSSAGHQGKKPEELRHEEESRISGEILRSESIDSNIANQV